MSDVLDALRQVTPAFALAVIAVFTAVLASGALRRLIARLHGIGHFTDTMAGRLQVARRWSVGVVTLLIVLQTTGLFAHAWALISAMLAAVAVGFFATWSVLSNATSALLILAFRPFRVGDRVELVEPTNATTLSGTVLDMNLMYTTLSEPNGETGATQLLHIPNNLFLQKLVRAHPQVAVPTEPFFRESMLGRPPDDDDA